MALILLLPTEATTVTRKQ